MTISELKSGQGNVNVQGTITEVGEIRVFSKFGKELKVANAILKDDSGTIKLTLWNDEANKYTAGDEIKIENGYVNEFQGEKQLTSGKFGQIELADGSDSEKTKPDEEDSGDETSSDETSSEDTEDAGSESGDSESATEDMEETEI